MNDDSLADFVSCIEIQFLMNAFSQHFNAFLVWFSIRYNPLVTPFINDASLIVLDVQFIL